MDNVIAEEKIKELTDSITAIASLDFSKRLDTSNDNSVYDLLKLSVNMLSEELKENVVSRKLLEQNELILKEAQSLGKIGSFELDMQSGEIIFSDELFRIYGLEPYEKSPSQELGLSFIHPDDKEKVMMRLENLRNKKNNCWDQEYRVIYENGMLRYVISNGKVCYNEDGVPIKLLGTIQDITKWKVTELKLQRQQQTTKKIENTLSYLHQITSRKEVGFSDQLTEMLRFGCAKFGMTKGVLCKIEGHLCELIEGFSVDIELDKYLDYPLNESICSIVVEMEALVAVKQVSRSKWHNHPFHYKHKIEAHIGIPINVNGAIYGTLSFSSHLPREVDFSSTDKTILKLMGQWVENQLEIVRNRDTSINNVIEAQESEKKRIAEDLHDSVGPLLSVLKLKTETLKSSLSNLSKEQEDSLSELVDLLGKTAKELRGISYNLIPPELIDFGLLEATQNLVELISQTKTLSIELHSQSFEERLEKPVELVIYRAIQEMLNNVIKHAEAKLVIVQFVKYDNKLVIMIEDDGKGFDMEKPSRGIGLKSIYSRVALLNGTVKIDSTENIGTSITINIPIKKK